MDATAEAAVKDAREIGEAARKGEPPADKDIEEVVRAPDRPGSHLSSFDRLEIHYPEIRALEAPIPKRS
jgi:hypothetical protein